MPDLIADKKAAIVLGEGSLPFGELRERIAVEAERFGSDRSPLFLNAEKTFEFTVRFLASLDARRPLIVMSSEWTPAERSQREAMVRNHLSKILPDTALVLFTSGTGGQPKAVQISYSGIEANTRAVVHSLRLGPEDSQHLFLPLSYSFGLLGQLLPALRLGMTTYLHSDFLSIKPIFDAKKIAGVLSGVSSQWSALVRMFGSAGPFEKVTHVVSAGSRLDPELKRKLHALFPKAILFNNYGQTEASPRILSMASDDPDFFNDVTGYAVDGIELKLVDGDELAAKGPQVMKGYLGDREATEARVREGWLHTGDRASIDDRGLVTILGRKDDLVKIAGERVSPLEIERLVEGTGWASEVCVIPIEDAVYGTRFALYLGAVSKDAPKDVAMIESLRKLVSASKVPSRIVRMDELPRSANGKFDREMLRKK